MANMSEKVFGLLLVLGGIFLLTNPGNRSSGPPLEVAIVVITFGFLVMSGVFGSSFSTSKTTPQNEVKVDSASSNPSGVLMICPNCKERIPVESKLCPECGASEVLMICPNCKEQIPIESKFCPECGEDFKQI